MTASASHIVLLNARAGAMAGSDPERAIRERFETRGVHADVRVLKQGEDIVRAAKRAIADKAQVIVAGGGDGTLNAVAGAIVGSAATFGVLPLGTLNHFAKDMGIPIDIDEAVDTVCTGRVVQVDVGRVNGHLFLNNSSLGLYPQVVRQRDELTQRLGRSKWAAFIWAAWTVLRRHPFVEVRLNVEGKLLAFRTPLVFIGNNSYELEGLDLGSRRCLDAGQLSIYVVARDERFGLILLAARALLGRLRQAKDFEAFCVSHAEVQTRRGGVMVATDGEVNLLQSPLVYQVEPQALPVLVPAERG